MASICVAAGMRSSERRRRISHFHLLQQKSLSNVRPKGKPEGEQRMSSRAIVRFVISFVVFAVFMVHVSGLYRFRLLDTVENFSYDARVLLTLPRTNDPRVVIVDLDEKSLAAEGQWPWPRNK